MILIFKKNNCDLKNKYFNKKKILKLSLND